MNNWMDGLLVGSALALTAASLALLGSLAVV